jgi:hypothetical protein
VTGQTTERMAYLDEPGWVLWSRARGGTTEGLMVYAQLYAENEGDRPEIVQLLVTGRNLTTDKLRSIPLGHIEALATTDPEFTPYVNGTPQGAMDEVVSAFRHQANRRLIDRANRRKPRKPLPRPDGSNPDAFYRQVADGYRDALKDTNKVAKVLAEEADVPVVTVHRWILEARRRGFLPRARKGRVG